MLLNLQFDGALEHLLDVLEVELVPARTREILKRFRVVGVEFE
jgi:hypothetical protein